MSSSLTIIQFGDQYINVETEKPATDEEIQAFKTKQALNKEEHEQCRRKILLEREQWHAEHDDLIFKFFNEENDEDPIYDKESISR